MKSAIHPAYHVTEASCSNCGTSFTTRSTREHVNIEVCSECHPFYTGRTRAAATGDRVERFRRREARGRAKRRG
jgi:large subunit ribosomal protein L31